ncbi:hypothetical protein JMUB6875_31340 [Nocardia sp. JMUB6875]
MSTGSDHIDYDGKPGVEFVSDLRRRLASIARRLATIEAEAAVLWEEYAFRHPDKALHANQLVRHRFDDGTVRADKFLSSGDDSAASEPRIR